MKHLAKLDQKQLKKFGYTMALMIPLFFYIVLPWIFSRKPSVLSVSIGGLFLIATLFYPKALQLVYVPWMKFAEVLGAVNSRIILGIVYFLIVVPIGFIFKLRQKDAMKRELDKHTSTYRILRNENTSNLERPF